MTDHTIYNSIAQRTNGDIYIGVVGPVRTGKSTLIKKLLEYVVIPNIDGTYSRRRALDEMPQSAGGRTVMTTEPKFIPEEAVQVNLSDGASFKVRLIDCVGYIVPGAIGHTEDGEARMVMTPWSPEPIPFEEAAENGTRRVINDHSTIGIVVTTDGTIGEIGRESYVAAERRAIEELKAINKPFVVVLNSADPTSDSAASLASEIESRYSVPVALVNCLTLDEEDIKKILELILFEFPVREISFDVPAWLSVLPQDHPLRTKIMGGIIGACESVERVGEVKSAFEALSDDTQTASVDSLSLGDGCGVVSVKLADGLFYRILGELTEQPITDERSLAETVSELSKAKKAYDRIADALHEAEQNGYGIVAPTIDDMTLEEPEIVRQSGGYGVRLKASAPSYHFIRANVETEVSPIVGTVQQSEELVKFLLHEFEEDPKKIWESNMFGKPLCELVGEGLTSKLAHMPADARDKLAQTLRKVINEGSGGMICILL